MLSTTQIVNRVSTYFILIILCLLSINAFAVEYPTAEVNTTGLAVTDDTVTVGILHSVTGTMAISESGSVEAEKLAIEGSRTANSSRNGSYLQSKQILNQSQARI